MKKKSSRIQEAHEGGSRFRHCLLAYRLEVCISARLELKCRVCGEQKHRDGVLCWSWSRIEV